MLWLIEGRMNILFFGGGTVEVTFKPTPEQVANLLRLADFLDALPDSYAQFRMRVFYARSGDWRIDELPENHAAYLASFDDRRTSAGAIGHGPAAGISLSSEDGTWKRYARRVFGACDSSSDEGNFMFGWHNPDDAKAAAARIREVALKVASNG